MLIVDDDDDDEASVDRVRSVVINAIACNCMQRAARQLPRMLATESGSINGLQYSEYSIMGN